MQRMLLVLLAVLLQPGLPLLVHAEQGGVANLLEAAEKGKLNVVNDLLCKGVDINGQDKDGFTALMYAAANDHVKVLISLLKKGADVHAKSKSGGTALMCATRYGKGRIETVKPLLAAGADVAAADEDGKTALSWAINKKRTKVISLLKQAENRR